MLFLFIFCLYEAPAKDGGRMLSARRIEHNVYRLRRCASQNTQTRGIKRGFAGERNVGERNERMRVKRTPRPRRDTGRVRAVCYVQVLFGAAYLRLSHGWRRRSLINL